MPWAAPLQMQIAAGIGFMAYLLAMAGLRSRHRPIEIAGWSLAFSAIFLLMQAVLDRLMMPIAAGAWAALVTLAAAVFWRSVGWRAANWIGRKLRISRALPHPDVESWLLDQHPAITQIGVVLKDGTEITCLNTEAHWDELDKAENRNLRAPVFFADDGSIALVAEEVTRAGQDPEKHGQEFIHDEWGTRLTVLRADQIAWYWIRMKRAR